MAAKDLYRYQTNSGSILQVSLTEAVAITDPSVEPAGPVTIPGLQVSVSTSSRSRTRLRARGVNIRRVDATGPSGVRAVQYARITCLTAAGAATLLGTNPISYDGKSDWTPVGLSAEG